MQGRQRVSVLSNRESVIVGQLDPRGMIIRPCYRMLFLLALFVLLACAREEVLDDIQSDYFEPQLVIHSLITPGDSVLINVGRSGPLGDSLQATRVTDALVTITDGQGRAVRLPLVREDFYTTVYGISEQDFSIQAGTTYTLSVTHSELPAVEASCTVPETATPLQAVRYIGKSRFPDDGRFTYDVQVTWYDSGPYLHRVYFSGDYTTTNPEDGRILEQGVYRYRQDPFHGIEQADSLFTYYDSFFSSKRFYTDTLPNGTILSSEPIEAPTTYQLATYLVTPDEHMARYQASQEIFAQNESELNSGSFIGLYRGIIPEYSNVRGGLGVFGAYLRSEPVYLTLE